MKIFINYLLLVPILFLLNNESETFAQPNLNLFSEYSSEQFLNNNIKPFGLWEPFPKDSNVIKNTIGDSLTEYFIQEGEVALDYPWPTLTANLMLDFTRNGNRSRYQDLHFERRDKLKSLVLAEFFENKGRFTDQIVNGIWSISEESYWGVPAHLYLQEGDRSLVNVEEPTVDLFAAETASLLSWTHYLLKDKIDKVSQRVNERIKSEIEERILTPNFNREDFWWMGYDLKDNEQVNNWNPWIVSNWLTAVLLFEEDKDRRTESIQKILEVLGHFVNRYPQDGGCDEGPSYWGHAGASLFDCLELLYSASDGAINIYNEPLINNIGSYIYKAYIGNNYFVNFADATAELKPNAALIHRFGTRTNNAQMQKFGAYLFQENLGKSFERNLFRVLQNLNNRNDLINASKDFAFPREVWLPDSEVFAARSNTQNKGFYLASKAGHNAESHNHNDVGNFIVYYNATPVLVDAGVGTYTAKTFSSDRYDIWNMQSAFHNLPTINGFMQSNGRKYSASDVSYKSNSKYARFKINIASAYPDSAAINYWNRTIQLNRGKNIILTEKYSLKSSIKANTLSLISPCEVTVTEPGEIRLNLTMNNKKERVYLNYDPSLFSIEIEKIKMENEEDGRLKQVWTEGLSRIILTEKRTSMNGNWKFLISSY